MTFAEIYAAVERAIKQSGGKRDLVKNMINQVYLTEVLNADTLYPLFWQVRLSETVLSKAPMTITGITGADPAVVTVANSLAVGDIVSIHGVLGMTELNDKLFKVSARDATTATLSDLYDTDTNSSGYTAYSSAGIMLHRGTTLGSSVKRILSAGWADEKPMQEVLPEKYNSLMDRSLSIPDMYLWSKYYKADFTEENNLIWFDGAQDQQTLQLWYVNNAAALSADADVPQLPVEFHNAIVSGAITRLYESKVQVEAGVIWPGLYNNQLGAIVAFNQQYYQQNEFERREKPYLL